MSINTIDINNVTKDNFNINLNYSSKTSFVFSLFINPIVLYND